MEQIRPNYYKGLSGQQVFDVIRDFQLDFFVGNILKYIIRAGHKTSTTKLEDLRKARTYLDVMIEQELEKEKAESLVSFGESLSKQTTFNLTKDGPLGLFINPPYDQSEGT